MDVIWHDANGMNNRQLFLAGSAYRLLEQPFTIFINERFAVLRAPDEMVECPPISHRFPISLSPSGTSYCLARGFNPGKSYRDDLSAIHSILGLKRQDSSFRMRPLPYGKK